MGAHLDTVLRDRDELFLEGKFKIVTDCVRQWSIIIFGTFLIIYFAICSQRIYKTNGSLTFDSFMLLFEALKVSL